MLLVRGGKYGDEQCRLEFDVLTVFPFIFADELESFNRSRINSRIRQDCLDLQTPINVFKSDPPLVSTTIVKSWLITQANELE